MDCSLRRPLDGGLAGSHLGGRLVRLLGCTHGNSDYLRYPSWFGAADTAASAASAVRLFGFIALDEASVSSGTSIAKGASSGLVALAAASGTSDDLGVSLVPPPMRGNQLIEAFRTLGDP